MSPFAGYKDFDTCIAENGDKDNPRAFCGWLMHRTEKAASPFGGWNPRGLPVSEGGKLATIRQAAKLRRQIMTLFRAQALWLEAHWWSILTEAQRRNVLKAEIDDVDPTDWEAWVAAAARHMLEPITEAMGTGGDGALADIRSVIPGGVTVDWTIHDPGAQRWAARHAATLARNLNRTTLTRVRTAVSEGIRLGQGTTQIRDRITETVRGMSERRATLIAQTEVVRAQSQGALQAYTRAGVDQKRWLDLRVNHCPTCARLNGQTVPIDEPFVDPETGDEYDAPPAHPNCQCAIRAVVPAALAPVSEDTVKALLPQFEEQEHPRVSGGTGGGQFTEKPGAGGASPAPSSP